MCRVPVVGEDRSVQARPCLDEVRSLLGRDRTAGPSALPRRSPALRGLVGDLSGAAVVVPPSSCRRPCEVGWLAGSLGWCRCSGSTACRWLAGLARCAPWPASQRGEHRGGEHEGAGSSVILCTAAPVWLRGAGCPRALANAVTAASPCAQDCSYPIGSARGLTCPNVWPGSVSSSAAFACRARRAPFGRARMGP